MEELNKYSKNSEEYGNILKKMMDAFRQRKRRAEKKDDGTAKQRKLDEWVVFY